jgi:hypothetical protein
MASNIKPNTLCWLVQGNGLLYSTWVGRVVTAMEWHERALGYQPGGHLIWVHDVHRCYADWLPNHNVAGLDMKIDGWMFSRQNLKPIIDGDLVSQDEVDKLYSLAPVEKKLTVPPPVPQRAEAL